MITIYPSKFDFPSLLRPSAVPENIFKNRKKTEGWGWKDIFDLSLSQPMQGDEEASFTFYF